VDRSRQEERQISGAVIACFLISGAVGLVYEVLWIRMLGLVFGHTIFAITTVLAAFMGGLALGSFLFGRLADRSARLLMWYGLLEIGIGGYCLLLPTLLQGAGQVYLAAAPQGSYVVFTGLQAMLVALLLLPPTTLMGATLPVLARFFVREEATLGRKIGVLYAVNTGGAVVGTLLAGYWLLPLVGIRTTLHLAVVTNLGIGALVLVFDRHLRQLGTVSEQESASAATGKPPLRLGAAGVAVAVGFGLSGAASMVYEVSWSRALTLAIGSSTYAFTAMLVAFLCGIAGGSSLFAALLGGRRLRPSAFALLQLAIGLSAAAVVPVLGRMPAWFLSLFQYSSAPAFVQVVQFGLSFAAMILPTLLIGATFPCAVRVLARGLERVGYDTGWIYAVNTLGAIVGSAVAGFALVPLLGMQATMKIGIWLNVVVAAWILLADAGARSRVPALAATALTAVLTGLLPAWNPAVLSSGVAVYGAVYLPFLKSGDFFRSEWRSDLLYYRDGISATVTVHQDGRHLQLRVNGKTDASNGGDMHTQLFSGHLPMLLHPSPRRVLVIGLGSGITVGAVAQYPVERIDVVEIEPAVAEAAQYFGLENREVLKDPRVRLVVGDGRNFLASTEERYDVIISEPSNPWIRGLATLFTREFFALAQSRLAANGIMLQWIQGYGILPDDLRMVVATFRTAFPQASLWKTQMGDNLLVGTERPVQISLARIRARAAESPAFRDDLRRAGLHTPAGLLTDFVLGPDELTRFAGDAPLNTDDTLALEFSTPRSLYLPETASLNYRILADYRRVGDPPVTPEERRELLTAQARYEMGRALRSKGFPQEAEREFAASSSLDPLFLPSRLEHAELLIQRGAALKAMRILESARDGRHAKVHFLAARAYQQQEMPAEARRAMERAVALDPADIEARVWLAGLLRQFGDLPAAVQQYEEIRRLRPGDIQHALDLADLQLKSGRPAEAMVLLQKVSVEHEPVRIRARLSHLQGLAELQAGRPLAAATLLDRARRMNPINTDVRFDLSAAYEAAGQPHAALEVLDALLAMQPDHLVAARRAADLSAKLQRGGS
jgi:spermidine synthase